MATPIVTPAEMAAIDAAAPEPVEELIRRAATAVAWHARDMLGGVYGRRVAVVAGPGNNGADALGAAAILASWGVRVRTFGPDIDTVPECDLVIDGAFGTGLSRPYRAPTVQAGTPVLAVDIPSGVNGLTGELVGRPLAATRTVTFAALKPGLLLHPGAGLAGDARVVDIGLDASSAQAHAVGEADVRTALVRRAATDHKWKHSAWVIGGSAGMTGAPMLAARAALRAGAGLVRCTIPGAPAPAGGEEIVFVEAPEEWIETVADDVDRIGALVVGCGMGRSDSAHRSVQKLVDDARLGLPMVIDGDGLRLLGLMPLLRESIVLTPHDGEYTSLTGAPPVADRFEATRALARQTGATVLLKGPTTIVSDPAGRCLAVTRGDERLATAGSGDVLAGIIGAFLASGASALYAAATGAWVHGDVGRSGAGVGLIASDLLAGLPVTLSRLTSAD